MLITHRNVDDTLARMDRLMSGLLGTTWTPAPRFSRAADLHVDVLSYEDRYELQAEVPGLGVEDVALTIDDGMLLIEGKRQVTEEEGARALVRERLDYTFKRRFRIPPDVDIDAAGATVRNGILTVRLPRATRPEPRRIAVSSD